MAYQYFYEDEKGYFETLSEQINMAKEIEEIEDWLKNLRGQDNDKNKL